MSHNPTASAHPGFPQAYNQQQYQHVAQFNQFPSPQTSNINNGKPTYAANPFPMTNSTPFPQSYNNAQVPVGQKPQLPQVPPQPFPSYGAATSAANQVNGVPQPNKMQMPLSQPRASPIVNTTSSTPTNYPTTQAYPYPQQQQRTPQMPQQSQSMPQQMQTMAPQQMPSMPQQMQPIPKQMQTMPQPIQPMPQQMQPMQQQMQPMQQQMQPMQQQMNQMHQNFGQMNMGGPPALPNGSQFRSDVIDLVTEKNVMQYPFDDIEVTLPSQMANPNVHVDPSIFRSTVHMIPQSEELLKKSRLPFAITLHPFRDVKNLNIIQTSNIVRCRLCRTYINPYVYMPDNRHWKCNLCNRNNDLPDDFCWDPATKQFGDPCNRPEIQNATVEFIAPSEYTLRPPQPSVYVFVLDVSTNAINSGYLRTFSEQLLVNFDQMPGDERTQMAFVAVDSCLHFFSFSSTTRGPSEMIVDDIDDAFLPSISSLLVSVKKYKDVIKSFIQNLPNLYPIGPTSNGNCLGSALKICHELIAEVGGRISVFQVSLPNKGLAALTCREDSKAPENPQNFGPATDFYKALALECTGNQVGLDLFMFNTQYADIATLSEISKFSTGCIYHFPNFNFNQNSIQTKRFEKTITRYLTRKIGFEAVLRIRTSRGLALSGFYGNFFVRSPDLLALANVNPDSALAAQVTIEEKLPQFVCFQSALLYTSSKGDRRIRVHTMCLPTTGDLLQLYNHFDLKATVSYLAKIGVDRSMAGGALSDSREALVNAVVDSVGSYQKSVSRSGGMLVPRSGHLKFFPSFSLAMLKHAAFSSARGMKLDERVAAMLMLRFSPLEQILAEFYAKLYRLNDLLSDEFSEEKKNWPHPLPLSFEFVQRDGIYAMDAGSALYIYVSAASNPQMISDLFGCAYNEICEDSLIERDNATSKKVFAFLKHITMLRFYLGPCITITEHSPLREQFVRRLINDRSESSHSYVEFVQHLKREISS